jgi:RimJ/RimL family protein N-acetyltransferase
MNIVGKKVILRAIEESDLRLIHEWSNDPELGRQLGGWHFPYSRVSLNSWFEKSQNDPNNKRFAIDFSDNGIIGTVTLLDIDWKNNHAHTGMLIGDSSCIGKGLGVDSIMTLMRYAFEELNLNRLNGDIIEYNIASYKSYVEKCGWVQEGIQKDYYFRSGKYWNRILVAVMKKDYYSLIEKNKYWLETNE